MNPESPAMHEISSIRETIQKQTYQKKWDQKTNRDIQIKILSKDQIQKIQKDLSIIENRLNQFYEREKQMDEKLQQYNLIKADQIKALKKHSNQQKNTQNYEELEKVSQCLLNMLKSQKITENLGEFPHYMKDLVNFYQNIYQLSKQEQKQIKASFLDNFWARLEKKIKQAFGLQKKILTLYDQFIKSYPNRYRSQSKHPLNDSFEKQKNFQQYKPVYIKFQPIFEQFEKLSIISREYCDFFATGYKHEPISLHGCFSQILDIVKKSVQNKAKQMIDELGFSEKTDRGSLHAFLDLFDKYKDQLNAKYQQLLINDKSSKDDALERYRRSPTKKQEGNMQKIQSDEKGIQILGKGKEINQLLNQSLLHDINQINLQKCANLLQNKGSYQFQKQRIVASVLIKLQNYLQIPDTVPNLLEYLKTVQKKYLNQQHQQHINANFSNFMVGGKTGLNNYQDYEKNKQNYEKLINDMEKKIEKSNNLIANIATLLQTNSNEKNILKEIQDLKNLGLEKMKFYEFIDNLTQQIIRSRRLKQDLLGKVLEIQGVKEEIKRANQRKKLEICQKLYNAQRQLIEMYVKQMLYLFADSSQILTTLKNQEHFYVHLEQLNKSTIMGFSLLHRQTITDKPLTSLKQNLLNNPNTLLLIKFKEKDQSSSIFGYFSPNSYQSEEEQLHKDQLIISSKLDKTYKIKAFLKFIESENSLLIGKNMIRIDLSNFNLSSSSKKAIQQKQHTLQNIQIKSEFLDASSDLVKDIFNNHEGEKIIEMIQVFQVHYLNQNVYKNKKSKQKQKKTWNQLEIQNQKLASRNKQLEYQIRKQQKQLRDSIEKAKTLITQELKNFFQKQKDSLTQKISDLSKKIQSTSNTNQLTDIQALKRLIQGLKQKNKQLSEDKNKYSQIIKTLKKRLDSPQNSKKEEEGQKISPQYVQQLENKVKISAEQSRKLQERIQTLIQRIKELQQKNKALQEQKRELRIQNCQQIGEEQEKKLRGQPEQKQKIIQIQEKQKQILRCQIDQLKTQLKAAKDLQQNKVGVKKYQKSKCNEISINKCSNPLSLQKCEELCIEAIDESVFSQSDQIILQQNCKTLSKKIEVMNFDLKQKENKLNSVTVAIIDSQKTIYEKRKCQTQLNACIQKQKHNLADLEKQSQSMKQQVQKNKKELEELRKSLEKIVIKINEAKQQKEKTEALISKKENIQKQIEQLQVQKKSIQQIIELSEGKLAKIKLQLEEQQKQIKIDKKQISESPKMNQVEQIQQEKQASSELHQQCTQLNKLIENLKIQKNEIEQLILQQQHQCKTLKQKNNLLFSQIAQLTNKKKQLTENVENLEEKYEQLVNQLQQLQVKIKTLQAKKKRVELDKQRITNVFSPRRQDPMLQRLKIQIQIKNKEIVQLKGQLKQKSNNQIKYQNQISKLTQQLKEQQLKYLSQAVENQMRPVKQEQNMFERRNKQKEAQKDRIVRKIKKGSVFFLHIETPQTKTEKNSSLHNSLFKIQSLTSIQRFFNGKINLNLHQKQFMHQQILTQYSGNKYARQYEIKNSQILFFYPEMDSLNFHDLVDNRQNLMIVIQLKEPRKLIAVYSEAILTKQQSEKFADQMGSFLAVLDPETPKVFYLNKRNPKAKPLVYNDYYLVIGNSQLRIKRGSDKAESNIPTNFQYFDTKEERSPEFMFGVKGREAIVQRYQIYEIKIGPI